MPSIILMSDPEVAGVPVQECGEPLVDLRELPFVVVDSRQADPEGSYAHLREGVVWRLARAARLLPDGLRLLVTEGTGRSPCRSSTSRGTPPNCASPTPTGRRSTSTSRPAVPSPRRRSGRMSRAPRST